MPFFIPFLPGAPSLPTVSRTVHAPRYWTSPPRFFGKSNRLPPRHFTEKVCALTFDDGPTRKITPAVLKILEREKIPATFFVMGCQVSQFPDLLKREVAAGHAIGVHTYFHFMHPTPAGAKMEMTRCEQGLIKTLGANRQTWLFRSPFGYTKSAYTQEALKRGYANILWSNSSADTATQRSETVYRNIVPNIEPGQVIICHDSAGKQHTVNALARVIIALKKKGYRFVTVPELMVKWDAVAAENAKHPFPAKKPSAPSRKNVKPFSPLRPGNGKV